jgi:hypothetical protein
VEILTCERYKLVWITRGLTSGAPSPRMGLQVPADVG